MLKCRDISLLASDYIDGRLKWHKRLSVTLHLMVCPPCRGFMANFRLAVQLLQGQVPPEISQETLQRFDETVQERLVLRSRQTPENVPDDSDPSRNQ